MSIDLIIRLLILAVGLVFIVKVNFDREKTFVYKSLVEIGASEIAIKWIGPYFAIFDLLNKIWMRDNGNRYLVCYKNQYGRNMKVQCIVMHESFSLRIKWLDI